MTTIEEDLGTARKLIMGLGTLVYYYAQMEHWIDGAVAVIFFRVDGAKTVRKTHPTRAADEIEFLEKCFQALPCLEPFSERGAELIKAINHVSELRNGVVHGHLDDWDTGTNTLQFSRVRAKGGVATKTILSVTAPMLLDAGWQIRNLALEMRSFTQSLIKEFGTEEDRQNVSSVPQ